MARLQDEQLPSRLDFSDLQNELTTLAESLQQLAAGGAHAAEISAEAAAYRGSMEELQQLLPRIEGRLLAERARLENEIAHLGAAANWAGASRKTL
jgi:hypothetical protein